MFRFVTRTQSSPSRCIRLPSNVFHLHLCQGIFIYFYLFKFIFYTNNSDTHLFQLNIHKFKAIARFGLMHCLATNVCVWIRTLVRESLKEINHHYDHHPKEAQHYQMTQQQMVAASSAATATSTAADTQAFLHHMAEAVAAAVGSEEDGSSSVYEFGKFPIELNTLKILTPFHLISERYFG